MCGRYTLTRPGDEIAAAFDLDSLPEVEPRYNIAPTQECLIVCRRDDGRRGAELARWGFEGAAPGRLLINARAETAADKPSFRDAFRKRRCLVPADGFYEWRDEGGRRAPHHFTAADGGLWAFAALWLPTLTDRGEPHSAFSILTVAANETVQRVHPRMPLVLPTPARALWLAADASRAALEEVLVPLPAEQVTSRPVSVTVNKVANDSPACLAPPEPQGEQLDLLT